MHRAQEGGILGFCVAQPNLRQLAHTFYFLGSSVGPSSSPITAATNYLFFPCPSLYLELLIPAN